MTEECTTMEIEPVYKVQASSATSGNTAIVIAFKHYIKQVKGITAFAQGVSTFTVASLFRAINLNVVAWGYMPETIYILNEYIYVCQI